LTLKIPDYEHRVIYMSHMAQKTYGNYYVTKNNTNGFPNGDAVTSLRNVLKF